MSVFHVNATGETDGRGEISGIQRAEPDAEPDNKQAPFRAASGFFQGNRRKIRTIPDAAVQSWDKNRKFRRWTGHGVLCAKIALSGNLAGPT
jgi:hypothetical protein